jgi:hypothetical protein
VLRRRLGPAAPQEEFTKALNAAVARAEAVAALVPKQAEPEPEEPEPLKVAAEPAAPDEDEEEAAATAAEEELGPAAEPAPVELSLPGVAGEVQQYYLSTAMQPSEIVSLAVGLMVPTALVSGNVIGPTGPKGCALQQTLVVLVPTAGGKQFAIDCTKECVTKAGAQRLLGPNRFKSGAALVRHMKENRVQLCVQDEFGLLLAKLGNPKSNVCEVEINERMREFWALGPGSIYNSPVGAAKGDDSETIVNARLSILGFGNRDEFFAACKGTDINNGFLNRMVILEEPRLIRSRTIEHVRFPKALKENLCKLVAIKPRQLGWTASAREIFEAEKDRVFNQTDERKLRLWGRTPEKIMRAASACAASRFATQVERTDMEVAQAIMRMSDQRSKEGMDEAEASRQLDHAELKREIARCLRSDFPDAASPSEIKKHFKHNTKHKDAINNVLLDMVNCGMITPLEEVKTGGRSKWVHRVID